MRVRRLIGFLPVLMAVGIAAAAPAHANDAPGGSGGAFVDADDNPTAIATDAGAGGGSGAGGGDDCEWSVVIGDDFEYAMYDTDGRRLYSETGRWLQQICDGQTQEIGGSFIIPEGGRVDPQALAADALASVPIGVPPMFTSPSNDRLYTQMRTWLWVNEDWWRAYSATANAGRVSSTVTATPTRAEWNTGDGGGTTCRGPGVEWRRGMSDDATYCSHVYRRSSAGEDGATYTLSVTVWFEISWASNTGDSGTLAAISRSASRQVEVGQVQALETG